MEDEQTHIPNRLEKHRKIMGYTQKDVAFILGHKNTDRISKWEKGSAVPSVLNLIKLSVIYRTLMNDFYFDTFQAFRKDIFTKEAQLLTQNKEDSEPIKFLY
jgi:transcriptional regulator with XRE-family HTH domain